MSEYRTRMKSFEPYAYVLLRVLAGFLILFHGLDRLFEWPVGYSYNAYDRYIVGPIVLVGGAMLILGLFTRLAAFLCGAMVMGLYIIENARDDVLPFINRGEAHVLFLAAFLFIAAKGGGRLSFDRSRENQAKD